jgi:hypothetical protein
MPPFELFAFTTDPAAARRLVAAGVAGLVIDWECDGKTERQRGFDTQVNSDTVDDLRRLRDATTAPILCRLNRFGPATAGELELALEAGASEVLLPMVTSVREVESLLALAGGRCGVGILVETTAALSILSDLGRLPLSRVFAGLNDLAIERRSASLFTAIADGTVERIRRSFGVPFGFGGMTLPELGDPIPCALLVGEYVRLSCSFTFLRRSFHADMRGRDPMTEIPRMLAAVDAASGRRASEVDADHAALLDAIGAVAPRLATSGGVA